jgi:CHRD domain/PEP-CTERM motif
VRHFVLVTALAVLMFGAQSSRAELIVTTAFLDGPSEFPVNDSPGTGFSTVILDTDSHTLHVTVSFQDLLSPVIAAHIHARVSPNADPPTAGVATTVPTFPGFPLGVMSGTYDQTFDTTLDSTFNPDFITNNGGTTASAEAALAAALLAGEAYLNIHTDLFQGGEIRGFLIVPEPTSIVMLALGFIGVLEVRRRTRKVI